MKLRGTVFRFGNDINTDFIISGRYKFSITDMKELARHIFEDIRPNFYNEIIPKKSIIVAGNNFGLGSSREQAPWVIKKAGILCVIAKNFARIFYRNAFNVGLPLIEADATVFKEGDKIIVDLNKGIITDIALGRVLKFAPFDFILKDIGYVCSNSLFFLLCLIL